MWRQPVPGAGLRALYCPVVGLRTIDVPHWLRWSRISGQVGRVAWGKLMPLEDSGAGHAKAMRVPMSMSVVARTQFRRRCPARNSVASNGHLRNVRRQKSVIPTSQLLATMILPSG